MAKTEKTAEKAAEKTAGKTAEKAFEKNTEKTAAVAAGDLVELEFAGKADGKVFESSQAGKPVLVAAGKGQVVRGLDEALVGARAGEKRVARIPKEKAFGERNPELVRLVSLQKFAEQGIKPQPGLVLEIDGARARVQSASGGRVRVDFNHDLAGLDVEYDFEVKRVFRAAPEKIEALAEDLLKPFEAKAVFDAAGGAVRISVPVKARKDADFIMRKLRFIAQALQFVPEAKKVVFEEEYALQ